MKRITILTLVLTLFLIGCGSVQKTSNEYLEYEDFVNIVYDFKEDFKPDNFNNINKEGPLIKQIWVLPENILIDKRSNDGVDGNTDYPSKYEIYYLSEDLTVLTKFVFIYSNIDYQGIILQSIVSPEDNIPIKEDYHDIDRPFAINKIVSFGGYLVSVEHFLLNSNNFQDDNQKIMHLIKLDQDFYRQMEAFLLGN